MALFGATMYTCTYTWTEKNSLAQRVLNQSAGMRGPALPHTEDFLAHRCRAIIRAKHCQCVYLFACLYVCVHRRLKHGSEKPSVRIRSSEWREKLWRSSTFGRIRRTCPSCVPSSHTRGMSGAHTTRIRTVVMRSRYICVRISRSAGLRCLS
jgi:hypothetical protein